MIDENIKKEEPLDCTLGPWSLKLVNIGHEVKHALSVTTYPYQNGADIEDMGTDAETFRFSCMLLHEDYDENYSELRRWFLSRFEEPIELIHPKLGTLEGYPNNASFSVDRKLHCAEFTFDFTIADIQPEILSYADPYESSVEETKALNEEVAASVAEEMQQEGVPDVHGSEDWSLLDKWGEMGDGARAFAEATSKAIGTMLGVIDAVQSPVDAISSTIDYLDSLSGVLTKRVQECCDAFVGLSRKFTGNSRAAVSIMVDKASSLLASMSTAPAAVRRSLATLAASTISTEAAKLISDDEKRLGESIADESVSMDDAEGRPMAEESSPFFLTPEDLEDTLAMVRSFINSVLKDVYGADRIKRQAALLSDSVLRIKMEYMTTKTVRISAPTPIHKITLDNGLSYKSAARLCALNNVKNPNFIQGEVLVYES